MTSFSVVPNISYLLHHLNKTVSRNRREASHLNRYLHLFYLCNARNRLSMLAHTGYVAPYGLFDGCNSFFSSLPLGVTSRQSRATDYNEAIFILFKGNSEFHDLSLPSSHGIANERARSLNFRIIAEIGTLGVGFT